MTRSARAMPPRRIVILYPGDTSSERINMPGNYSLSRLLLLLHDRGDVPIHFLNRSPRYERYGNIEFIHFTAANFLRLAARLAGQRDTLIISQTGAYRRSAALLRRMMPGSRILIRLGGVYVGASYLGSPAFERERRMYRRRLAGADMVLSTADGTPVDLYMERVGIARDRYVKLLNGFPSIVNERGTTRENRIVCIARLSAEKAVDYVIRSFARALPRLREPHRLVIVGDGPERTRLQTLATELGVASAIVFAGESYDVGAFLYSAKLMVSGLANNTVMEAVATRTPVITVELGEIGALYGHLPNVHVVEYEPGGYGRIPPQHLEPLVDRTADAMVRVLNDYPVIPPMNGKARTDLYTWDQRLADELALYDRMFAR